MRFDYRGRVAAGTVLLLLIALYGGVTVLLRATAQKEQREQRAAKTGQDAEVDWITMYAGRFEKVRSVLPPNRVVGYVTDQPSSPGKGLRIAQYALAPVIIRTTVKTDLVLGNFHDGRKMVQIIRKEGLVPVLDCRNGVLLLRRKPE